MITILNDNMALLKAKPINEKDKIMTPTLKITETEDGRKVFTIDVGDMPAEEAMKYLEKVKTEIKNKRLT